MYAYVISGRLNSNFYNGITFIKKHQPQQFKIEEIRLAYN